MRAEDIRRVEDALLAGGIRYDVDNDSNERHKVLNIFEDKPASQEVVLECVLKEPGDRETPQGF